MATNDEIVQQVLTEIKSNSYDVTSLPEAMTDAEYDAEMDAEWSE